MNNPSTRIPLSTDPNLSGIVENLGTHYSGLASCVNEFLDNSISDYRAHPNSKNPRLIRVTMQKLGEAYSLRVEDSGAGIEDLSNALTIAGAGGRLTPLNEHGQGLNQACAYIVKNDGDWSLATRTESDRQNNQYRVVRAPYNQLDGTMEAEVLSGWGGELSSTGTVMSLLLPMGLLATLDPGVGANPDFDRLVLLLAENLRFTYSHILAANEVSIELVVVTASGQLTRSVLKPLEPVWKQAPTEITPTVIDLGGGPVEVSGQFGYTLPRPDCETFYQANLATSGAIISINGRVIASHLFSEIWNRHNHPSFNGFILRLDLRSDDLAALPETTAEKNGFRAGNPRLRKLFRYIRSAVPLPCKKHGNPECKLLDQLEPQFQASPRVMSIEREVSLSATLGPQGRADLVAYDLNGNIQIWEGKARKSRDIDLYQLRMYIDGAVHDGICVMKGVLIATEHPKEVKTLVKFLNTQTQEDGCLYRFELKTWQDFGIDPAAVN